MLLLLGQLSVSFLGPCCPAPLYCIAVHDCLMLIEQINDDDDDHREAKILRVQNIMRHPPVDGSSEAVTPILRYEMNKILLLRTQQQSPTAFQ